MLNPRPLKQSHLQVTTDLNAVAEVLQWFEKLILPQLPDRFWRACQLALVEGFTNAVRHAHRDLPKTTPIELELKVFPQSMEMRIWDRGKPFDLLNKLQSLLGEQDKDPFRENGRGLIFMSKSTDELSYERLSDNRNCLFMRKSVEGSE
ncbi:MAG TPA: anti-sigma regulatory factor [Cyanobacteria bacterium UBA11149]|nr:anti-sigma regulatory factor [Cyanobacteria bacterium UBA11367]HBE59280.1 anti-sigma regulatory factor [Cyanobacteria bacterium UBA11366]HBK64744.1 anti-sigma regulatory factor [Cyanobacteria bacterium UBA11166]HBR76720.1 anti-sigma regulatory factor [Cyanobacteria bacterium UBA11159]HBS68365.1 anti-sigma regulatory factor [Cyanobacteria bacterium UBA11153]HBW91505.1 anti-sigma regulatory factor [Cyanobacteria bacterium UBA11149]HCA94624.1 anti-sigma regulatory factor [Cyanobacteria bacter